jgi:hypothetical protein
MKPALLTLVGFGLLCGCGAQFKPETLVDRLRVLSTTMSPPEVRPGGSADLGILYLDPSRPTGKTTVVWVGCDPDPFNLVRGACNDTTSLLQPGAFADFPPGVKILGYGPKANYATASTLFDPLMADDPIRQNGTVGQVLAVVIGEEVSPTSTNAQLKVLFDRIAKQEVQTILALTRLTVSERDSLNSNPRFERITVDGEALPPNGTLLVRKGAAPTLKVTAPQADREAYRLLLPDGASDRTEALVVSWYSTAGRFSDARLDLDSGKDVTFFAPGGAQADDPVPEKRSGTVWSVLRDNRGGQAFTVIPFFICDDSLPEPKLTAITIPASSAESIVVSGENLGSVADVLIGPAALPKGAYSSSRDLFLGEWPTLAAGTYPVSVRSKRCTSSVSTLTATLP